MQVNKKLVLAEARLHAYRNTLPNGPDQAQVAEYHGILDTLAEASGEDLADFRIPEAQMRKIVTSFTRGSWRTAPRKTYSDKLYCESGYFKRQVDGLASYMDSLKPKPPAQNGSPDYWKMDDHQLEIHALDCGIKHPYGSGQQGLFFDRERVITELLQRDNALRATTPSAPTHVVRVETMIGSSIQQGTVGSTANVTYHAADVRNVVNQVKAAVAELNLTDAAREQINIDIQTIEPQLNSANPKKRILAECFHSIRAILEGVAAAGLVYEVDKVVRALSN
jgi:hypothetical protein